MSVRQAGKRQHEKSVNRSLLEYTLQNTEKEKQASQENLKSAILDYCKGAKHIVDSEGTRVTSDTEIWKLAQNPQVVVLHGVYVESVPRTTLHSKRIFSNAASFNSYQSETWEDLQGLDPDLH